MSNLIKAINVSKGEDSRVIDNNELIRLKMDCFSSKKTTHFYDDEEYEDSEFDENDEASLLMRDFSDENDDEWNDNESGSTEKNKPDFVSGIKVREVEIKPEVDYELIRSQIIDEANAEADMIVTKAREEADKIYNNAHNEGYRDGFDTGKKDLENERFNFEKEVELMRQNFNVECERKTQEIEPLLVETILKVFRQVTGVLSEEKKDVILHLVNNVLKKINISHDFIIRVSKEDYEFLIENKSKIYGAVIGEGSIEVIEDSTMTKNQCIIETESGMYDCSLDVQLENLTEEIKMLSCIND